MLSIPFPGNKKACYKRVREIFKEGGYDTVLEPFGGSCVLSVNLCNDGLVERGKAHVNDYDRFFDRYPEYLDIKDWIVERMHEKGIFRSTHSDSRGDFRFTDAEETGWVPIETQLLPKEDKAYLQSLMTEVGEEWWRMLSYGSVFNHATVPNHDPIRVTDFKYFKCGTGTERQRRFYDVVKGLDRDRLDWREFLENHRGEMGAKSLLIVDPPYFGAYNTAYGGGMTEEETRELLREVADLKTDFVFFNGDVDWIRGALDGMGLRNYTTEKTTVMNKSMTKDRKDGMVYVRNSPRGQ